MSHFGIPDKYIEQARKSMKSIVINLTCIAIVWSAHGAAFAGRNQSLEQLLDLAEVAGECALLDSQVGFQKTANIEGGWVFVNKFTEAKSNKLGKTTDEYLKYCSEVLKSYFSIRNSLSNRDGDK